MLKTLGLATLSALFSLSAAAAESAPSMPQEANANAPAELAHMANMIGRWKIEDHVLGEDGEWTPGPGADWDFYYTLDGYAIEDIWVQPPRAVAVEDEAKRTVGINLRKYDADAGKWVMSWMTKATGPVQTFSAQSTPEELVMLEDKPNASGSIRRITFYNMTGDNFDWRLEITRDEGETWREVYRIKGTRKV